MIILNIIDSIGSLYPLFQKINKVITVILAAMVFHKSFYFVIGMFFTRKFKPAKNKHKYAICIAARNEEKVIGNLLDSINKQDYDKDLLTVFVVADNCSDNTAQIARKYGAICYERHDTVHATKGYALQFLFKNIEKDYKTDSFEGFFIFDADNLLKKDYISKMNNAFDEGCKIITSYRNTKNFDENWISSNYALHWIRSVRTNHRARSVLRLATNIQGTGFLFTNEIVKEGWNYTSLTEDRALTADAVAQGYQITYQDEAEFYDEQPISLKIALRQRLRWSKGHLQAFAETGPYLFINIFFGKRFLKTNWNKDNKKKLPFFKQVVESIRHRFASFDTLSQLTPISFINLVKWLIISVIIYSCYLYTNGISEMYIFTGGSKITKLLRHIFDIQVNVAPGYKALFIGMLLTIWFRLLMRITTYISNSLISVYLFIVEEKRIKKIPLLKKIWFIIMWPWFDIIGRYTTYVALFTKVTWKPIPHESKITIDDLGGTK